MNENKNLVSRRNFLKFATISGLIKALSIAFNKDTVQFFANLLNSVKEGKVKEDIIEILESWKKNSNYFELGTKSNYRERWMRTSSEVYIYKLGEKQGWAGFFSLDNVSIHQPEIFEVKNEKGNPIFVRNFASSLSDQGDFFSLPLPQYGDIDTEKSEMTTSFLMFATTKNLETSEWSDEYEKGQRISLIDRKKQRGGLIIADNGKCLVADSTTFQTAYDNREGLRTLMEYSFVIDSTTLTEDISAIQSNSQSFKDILYSSRNTSCLITLFYDKEQSHKSFVFSLGEEYDTKTKKSEDIPYSANILDLVNLVLDFTKKMGATSFRLALPDPNEVGSIYSSDNYSLDIKDNDLYRVTYGVPQTHKKIDALNLSTLPLFRELKSMALGNEAGTKGSPDFVFTDGLFKINTPFMLINTS